MFLELTQSDLDQIVQPVITVCGYVVPVLIGIVAAVGAIYCIILGIKYAKADDPQEHEKAKNGLKNAIIGFVLIFILLIALKVGVGIFENWWATYEF